LQRQRWRKALSHDRHIGQAVALFQAADHGDAVADGGGEVTLRHAGTAAHLAQEIAKIGCGGLGCRCSAASAHIASIMWRL